MNTFDCIVYILGLIALALIAAFVGSCLWVMFWDRRHSANRQPFYRRGQHPTDPK